MCATLMNIGDTFVKFFKPLDKVGNDYEIWSHLDIPLQDISNDLNIV